LGDAQIVLAIGKVANANRKTNADLWQVLKGGSNSFGIVTRIDLTALESGDIWGRVILYPSSTIPDQITAFVNFTDNINRDPYGSLITFWTYKSATDITVVENAYEHTLPQANPRALNSSLQSSPRSPTPTLSA
jgi:FAD/FMN-containing dehydrogenase